MKNIAFTVGLVLCGFIDVIAQNVWFESAPDENQRPGIYRIFLNMFDSYGYDNFGQLKLTYGDGSIVDSFEIATFGVDTTSMVSHTFPGIGAYNCSLEAGSFELQGMNVADPARFYCEHRLVFDIGSYYSTSPRFGLNHEIVMCSDAGFYVNPIKEEQDGDSLVFRLTTLGQGLEIPNGVELNRNTGELTWSGMPDNGLYQFLMVVEEYSHLATYHYLSDQIVRFSIRVTDECMDWSAHDGVDATNLFETPGREFNIVTGTAWEYGFSVSKEGWDSLRIESASELFHKDSLSGSYSVTDAGDSLRLDITWLPVLDKKRNHPVLVTHHVTGFKDGKDHHRVLTNALYVDWPLGVSQRSHMNSIRIHPNPFTEALAIETPNGNGVMEVSLTDMQGRALIAEKTYTGSLQLSHLEAGIYVLKVKVDANVYTTSVVKQ